MNKVIDDNGSNRFVWKFAPDGTLVNCIDIETKWYGFSNYEQWVRENYSVVTIEHITDQNSNISWKIAAKYFQDNIGVCDPGLFDSKTMFEHLEKKWFQTKKTSIT